MRQHVIDPDVCVTCLSCLPVCPASAISERGGVVAIDPERCCGAGTCIDECTTGAIETWLLVPDGEAYSIEEQFEWMHLPGPSLT